MTLAVTIRVIRPRWARSYLEIMLGLARSGVEIDEDAVIERVNGATRYEIIDFDGNVTSGENP